MKVLKLEDVQRLLEAIAKGQDELAISADVSNPFGAVIRDNYLQRASLIRFISQNFDKYAFEYLRNVPDREERL